MNGFYGRLLRVDATNKRYQFDHLGDDRLSRTLGGKGLGTALLWDENPPGVDPLGSDNAFLIVTGPATGTRMWSQSRFGVYSKSPATGGYGESYSGGTLAQKIKGCGVDAIVITGACVEWSFLIVDDQGVRFEDARPHIGCGTFETERALLAQAPPGAGGMTIGPAGENMAAQACIKVDKWRSLGRGGMGAVLGSKRIKGIAFAGERTCEIANPEQLKQIIRQIADDGKASQATAGYQNYGTIMQVAAINAHKCFPTRYWSAGVFDEWRTLSADYMHKHFDVKRNGCPNCFLQCTKSAVVKSGRHAGLQLEGPEYETIYAIGGLNAIVGLEEVAWLNVICDDLGLDTMSAGNITAFATEASRRGRIEYSIDYNQPEKVKELMEMIAFRRGVGDLLASGIRHAASELRLEDIAVHVKGLEPAGFDPRVFKGMGLSYAVASRGACHLRGTFYKAEQSGQIPPDQITGKAQLMVDYEDRSVIFDSLILCRFFRDLIQWERLCEIVHATTDQRVTIQQLQMLANSVVAQTRAYNKREGILPEQDTLPARLLSNATDEGARITERELETLVSDYNRVRTNRTDLSPGAR